MARRQKKYHYIYKTTCNVNGKYYIGMHSTDNLDDGYLGSGKRLWYSINYHGKDNHTKEILEFCENRKNLKKREEEIVNEQLINEELCMNIKTGGQGGFVNEEHKKKFINEGSKNGRRKTNQILKEKYGENFFSIRSKMVWEVIKKDKDTLDLHKKKVRDGLLKSGFEKGTFYGKKHSEETKRKIGEANSKKQKGEKNSQYGTCWITRCGENKKIKKEELHEYIPRGWVKGRRINTTC
jgi:hypothetical protein